VVSTLRCASEGSITAILNVLPDSESSPPISALAMFPPPTNVIFTAAAPY